MVLRRAFSLIELMMVVAVISVLITVLLPAVQNAREASRRLQCRNHMKQLALAVVNYEVTNKRYPPAGLAGVREATSSAGSFDPRGGKMMSWVVLILPYMEESALYGQFDQSKSILEQPNEPQQTVLSSLLCSSDEANGRFFVDSSLTGGKKFAKGNYAAFVSPFHTDYTDIWPGGLSGNRPHFRRSIFDGLSRTMVISEVRTRGEERDQRGAWALPWTGSSLLAFDIHAEGDVTKSGVYQPAAFSLGISQPQNNLGPNADILYACPDSCGAQLEGMPCATFSGETKFGYLSAAPRSQHAGGVNVAFLDGHCGFLSDTVDEYSMAYLISPNDGKAVDLSSLIQ